MPTDAKRAGNARHMSKLERVTIWLHKDGSDGISKTQIEQAAKAAGMSTNAWVIDVIRDKL